MDGLGLPQWRRGGIKWSTGGSVDQWSQISITLMNRIRIRIEVKIWIRIRMEVMRSATLFKKYVESHINIP